MMKIVIIGHSISIKNREYIVNNIPKRFNVTYKPKYCSSKKDVIMECYRLIDKSDIVIALSKYDKYDPITLCELIYAKKSGKCIFEINISHPDIWLLNNLLRIKEDSINPNMIYKEV